jgi:hypothetical protein
MQRSRALERPAKASGECAPCLQLWGRAGERKVADARTCMVSNGGLGFGAMLLRRA